MYVAAIAQRDGAVIAAIVGRVVQGEDFTVRPATADAASCIAFAAATTSVLLCRRFVESAFSRASDVAQ